MWTNAHHGGDYGVTYFQVGDNHHLYCAMLRDGSWIETLDTPEKLYGHGEWHRDQCEFTRRGSWDLVDKYKELLEHDIEWPDVNDTISAALDGFRLLYHKPINIDKPRTLPVAADTQGPTSHVVMKPGRIVTAQPEAGRSQEALPDHNRPKILKDIQGWTINESLREHILTCRPDSGLKYNIPIEGITTESNLNSGSPNVWRQPPEAKQEATSRSTPVLAAGGPVGQGGLGPYTAALIAPLKKALARTANTTPDGVQKCTCELNSLMTAGCTCGAMTRERKEQA